MTGSSEHRSAYAFDLLRRRLTPTVVARAAAAGVEVLALTDHDTLAGLEEADQSAGVQGVKLVPGVEISASWRAQTLRAGAVG